MTTTDKNIVVAGNFSRKKAQTTSYKLVSDICNMCTVIRRSCPRPAFVGSIYKGESPYEYFAKLCVFPA